MFTYKVKEISSHSFIDYVLFSLSSETIEKIVNSKEKDGTLLINFSINDIELTEEEVETAFKNIIEYYVKDLKSNHKTSLQKQLKKLTTKYFDVEKEIQNRVKEQLKGKANLLANKTNSDLARIQRQVNFLRQSLDHYFK